MVFFLVHAFAEFAPLKRRLEGGREHFRTPETTSRAQALVAGGSPALLFCSIHSWPATPHGGRAPEIEGARCGSKDLPSSPATTYISLGVFAIRLELCPCSRAPQSRRGRSTVQLMRLAASVMTIGHFDCILDVWLGIDIHLSVQRRRSRTPQKACERPPTPFRPHAGTMRTPTALGCVRSSRGRPLAPVCFVV